MMDTPAWIRMAMGKSDGSAVNTLTRLSRSNALWMITEMDWTPESFPESEGELARNSFMEAIARFNLRAEVNAARQRNAEAPSTCTLECSTSGAVGSGDTHESSEAAVDPWVDTVEEGPAPVSRASSDAGWEMPSRANSDAGRPRKRAFSSLASAGGASQASSKSSRISNAMSAFSGFRKKPPPSI